MRKSGTSGKERRQGQFPSCFPDFQVIFCLSEWCLGTVKLSLCAFRERHGYIVGGRGRPPRGRTACPSKPLRRRMGPAAERSRQIAPRRGALQKPDCITAEPKRLTANTEYSKDSDECWKFLVGYWIFDCSELLHIGSSAFIGVRPPGKAVRGGRAGSADGGAGTSPCRDR